MLFRYRPEPNCGPEGQLGWAQLYGEEPEMSRGELEKDELEEEAMVEKVERGEDEAEEAGELIFIAALETRRQGGREGGAGRKYRRDACGGKARPI